MSPVTYVDGRQDYYLFQDLMKCAMHGDCYLAQFHGQDKGRTESSGCSLEPRNTKIAGRYFIESGMGFVSTDDSRLSF